MSAKMSGVFVCQKCQRPLHIVEQGRPMTTSALRALRSDEFAPAHLGPEYTSKEAKAIKLLGESFVLLDDSDRGGAARAGPRKAGVSIERMDSDSNDFHAKRVEALAKIFEIVSDKCQIDCPLCDTCSNEVMQLLKRKVKTLEAESKLFRASIERLRAEEAKAGGETAQERKEQEREKKLTQEVKAEVDRVKAERRQLEAEVRKLEEESSQLDEFEKKFWDEYQEFQLDLSILQTEQGSIRQKIDITRQQLEQLKQINVYDDAFYITASGHFGSINGFKLGRLPAQTVGWDEINAALGQVVLLLHSIARQVRFEFRSVVLHPFGSYSKIADRKNPEVLNELYHYSSSEFFLRQGSSSSSAGKRFKTALCLLLVAVKEFGQFGESKDPHFRLPKSIQGDKIGGLSIQTVVAETNWTKALKYLLTNLKYLLAWCSKYSAAGFALRS